MDVAFLVNLLDRVQHLELKVLTMFDDIPLALLQLLVEGDCLVDDEGAEDPFLQDESLKYSTELLVSLT